MIPFANATLTAVTAPGNAQDYDTAATTGAARWAGVAGVYVAETLTQVESPGRVDEILQTRVEIPYDVGKLVTRGDVLSYTLDGVAKTRKARNIIYAPLVGRARITLEPA